MANLDVHYHVTAGDGTTYRLHPNPDAPPGTGFRYGGVLEFSDTAGSAGWRGYFFVSPDALRDMAEAFSAAADDVGNTLDGSN